MKELCSTEWFPYLEQRLRTLSGYINLSWQKDENIDAGWVPIIQYSLSGDFPPTQSDRVVALLLEIKSVLSRVHRIYLVF